MVALAGDPRTSNQAIQAVYAAALANGGSLDDAAPGLAFFKQLERGRQPQGRQRRVRPIASGETPITIRWTYNALANRDATAASGGPKIEVVVPKSGRFGGVYVQAISAYAPHPNAAKLWMEFLYSDEGQNLWLKGYCHPIRYTDLVANNKVPADQLAKLPDVTGAVFPTLDQLEKANKLITSSWDAERRRRHPEVARSHTSPDVARRCRQGSRDTATLRRVPCPGAASFAWLGVVPFFLFSAPSCSCRSPFSSSGASRRRTAPRASRTTLDLSDAVPGRRVPHQHRDQPRHGDRRWHLRLAPRLRRDPGRPARGPALGAL